MLRHVAYEGGTILFIGNRMPFEKLIRYTAIGCGEFYVTEKWRGGTLSNKSYVCCVSGPLVDICMRVCVCIYNIVCVCVCVYIYFILHIYIDIYI